VSPDSCQRNKAFGNIVGASSRWLTCPTPIAGSAGGQYIADRHPGPAGGAGATPLYGGVAKPNAGSRGRDQTDRGHHFGKQGGVAGRDQWSICVTRRSVQGRAPQLGSPPGQVLAAWSWTHSAVPIDMDRRWHDRGGAVLSGDFQWRILRSGSSALAAGLRQTSGLPGTSEDKQKQSSTGIQPTSPIELKCLSSLRGRVGWGSVTRDGCCHSALGLIPFL
jgi:hypothetical protein